MNDLPTQTQQALVTYMQKKPEVVFEWTDPQSDAEGILIINSLRNGACGGGTRVSKTLDRTEMSKLAKTMELKFSLYGPSIGGAKSGIKMDPSSPNKYKVLKRWFSAIRPLLKECYGTAADLNTDFAIISDTLRELGLDHPQFGIINALPQFKDKQRSVHQLQHLTHMVTLTPGIAAPVAQLATGFTIVEAIKEFYDCSGIDIKGKTAFVQGVGTVGAAAAFYLSQLGVKLIALSDKDHGIIDTQGSDVNKLTQLVKTRQLAREFDQDQLLDHTTFNQRLSEQSIDIFVPAAGPYLVTKSFINQLIDNDLEIMVSGSNIPFDSDDMYGVTEQSVDKKIALIPGFVASGGMARAFYAAMKANNHDFSYQDIFNDTSTRVRELVNHAMHKHQGTYLATSLYQQALQHM